MTTVVKFVPEVLSKLSLWALEDAHFFIDYFKLLSLQEAKPNHF